MKQVDNIQQVMNTFELLGIKEVTKPYQKRKGTQVFELPFKTAYATGGAEINRFSVYKSGYVRKMIVNGNGASYGCYQLNKKYKTKEKYFNSYYKEYFTSNSYKRILIHSEEDRLVYLCNYILRNYYQTDKISMVGDFTRKLMSKYNTFYCQNRDNQLPFSDEKDDIKVIINGHRYNLS
tara:strand:+ start:210 stop:746 length:537 start_codon:yes stop_codon:yes gene_type:complete